MMSPGTKPAAKSPPTDTCITYAYTIMMMLGGMMGPMIEDAAVTAAANRRVYPSFSMAGIRIEPSAEVSATAEPLKPANMMEDRMFTWASPPRRWPTTAFANRTSRAVMSPTFMIWPASMKSGIASSGNWLIPANILWGRTLRKTNWSASTKPASGAKTSANTMGTPSAMVARKMRMKALDTFGSFRLSVRCGGRRYCQPPAAPAAGSLGGAPEDPSAAAWRSKNSSETDSISAEPIGTARKM